MQNPILETLSLDWLEAKADEDAAKKRRHEIEEQIAKLLDHPEDGSKTHSIDGFKIVTTGRLSYRADIEKLQELASQLPENMRPIKTETVLDARGAKWLRNNEPKTWAIIAPAIELRPGKVGIRIEQVEEK